MNLINIEEHKNNIVKKHNDLIRAKGELSSTAFKMLCTIISMIRVDDSEFQEYALKTDDYLKLIDSKSNNDEFIKEQALELMRNPFVIDGKAFNWCSMVDFKRIPGYIIFDIHPKLKPYLLELKNNFTQYQISNILTLKGEYTPRLYELLIQQWNMHKEYNQDSKSFTFELEIDKIRELFKIPKSYKYNDIKRNIIDKAQKQFKEKTNIQFTYEEHKIARKVDKLIITIKENSKGSKDYLRSEKAFIDYMRKNFVNKEIAVVGFEDNSVEEISVSPEGHLYGLRGRRFNSTKSKEFWKKLYRLALENKLKILKTDN